MEAMAFESGAWRFMLHGFWNGLYQDESEPRGDAELFSTNMAMLEAARALGRGRLDFRGMVSLEPTLGREGYPLLLQTGESADGRNPLFDRQHPHDLFMEVAVSYAQALGRRDRLFVYFAPVGEPAIGPTAFMHRGSASDNPIAPLSHHWLDGAHISYGVLSLGWTHDERWKIDVSLFNGREPDADRWDFDSLRFDSLSARLTWNPTANWSAQMSGARVREPDRLHPGLDVIRFTASATYNRPSPRGNWQTTLAYGRNDTERLTSPPEFLPPGVHYHFTPGVSPVQHALLAETGWRFASAHGLFARAEWVQKNELFLVADRRHDLVYDAAKLGGGYVFDFIALESFRVGAGAYASLEIVPRELELVYGATPRSWGLFLRVKIV
jgi:hypothetical protein